MRRKSRMLVAVVAALALSGVLAGQALATETLWFVPQTGKYPIKSAVIKGGRIELEQEKTNEYGCASVTGEGEFTSHKAGTMKFVFKGCGTGLGTNCQSTGAETGEIKTGTLPVELVYTSKAKHEAALDLNYEEPTETFPPPPRKQFATWHCKGQLLEYGPLGIRGSILAPVTPVNTQSNAFKLKLSQKEGVQSPASYETEAGKAYKASPEMALLSEFYSEGAAWSLSQLELTTPKIEGTFEIKA